MWSVPSVDLQSVSGHTFCFFVFVFFGLLLFSMSLKQETNGKVYSVSILNLFNTKQNKTKFLMWASQEHLNSIFFGLLIVRTHFIDSMYIQETLEILIHYSWSKFA